MEMKQFAFAALCVLSACWRDSTPTVAHAAPGGAPPEPTVQRDRRFVSIPREKMRSRSIPSDDAELLRLLAGYWEGKKYDYNGDTPGFEGEEGDAPRETLELRAGRFKRLAECSSLGRFAIEHQDADVVLTLNKEASCLGNGPLVAVYYIHHLDPDILVLIDGSTANVLAYRRIQ